MGDYYFYLVVLLFLLAIADLVIGVSNDAVNFLNSSLGSRAANRKVIMWIASAGILIGALSSGGMMEIAQKGVFRPGMFVFDEIMIIFVAVMLTDILLLDFFNTFALPTSTTVSIVFELLGAACAVALYKIFAQGEALAGIGTYINGTNALIIVSGIFLSVLLAFTFGLLVQYASRLLFTFHYEYQARFTAPVFGAVAITSITYFLLIKGLKGSGLLSPDAHAWIKTHTVQLIVLIFGAWLVINSVLAYFRVNILRVVVLTGTFALAMAFAGNDLVNFIGVAIGGLTSYEAFAGSGVDPSSFSMAVLENPVESQTIILLAAGLVMVLTLWFSKKAQAVTETEINLSRQGIGAERFKANLMSRLIVRGALAFGTVTGRFVPRNVQNGLEERFYPRQNEIDPPPFDLVRASVNLMVASVLIAVATSYKLPLSTTYVSFMVAMGTSLADRAWDRDSAVFRVSGVLHVIGGWLFTAILAFSAAGLFALLIRQTGGYGILGLTLLSIVLVAKNTLTHRKRVSDSADRERPLFLLRNPSEELLFLESKNEIQFTLSLVRKTFHQSIKGLLEESRRNLRIAKTKSDEIKEISDDLNRAFLYHVRSCKNREAVHMQYFISVIGQVQHLAQITEQLASLSSEYVENKHTPLNAVLKKDLANLDESLRQTYKTLDGGIEKNSVKALIKSLEEMRSQIKRIQKMIVRVFDQEVEPGGSSKLSFLVVNVYIRSIDMINASMHLTEYYIEFLRANEKETYEVSTSSPSTL